MKNLLLFCCVLLWLVGGLLFFTALGSVSAGADLPSDEHRLSLLVHDDWQQEPSESRIVGWFQNHFQLKELRCELYTQSDRVCRESLCLADRTLPCILLQRSDGYVAYKVSGASVPDSAEELCNGLFKPGVRYLLPWRRPRPTPAPPKPMPEDVPEPFSPDVRDVEIKDTVEVAEEAGISPWLLIAGPLLLFGGLTSLSSLRKTFSK